MGMRPWAKEACDQIDAGLFSGDAFHDHEAIARVEWYMERWQRRIVEIKALMVEFPKEDI